MVRMRMTNIQNPIAALSAAFAASEVNFGLFMLCFLASKIMQAMIAIPKMTMWMTWNLKVQVKQATLVEKRATKAGKNHVTALPIFQ